VHATAAGSLVNTTSTITAGGLPPGNPAAATLTVNAALTDAPADSGRLRALQAVVSKVEAQSSGAAFAGSVAGAIAGAPPPKDWQLWADLRRTVSSTAMPVSPAS
jgi:hypothetical protein